MASTKSGKICLICGEDCSNRPRTRDKRGNYYCQSCYARAKQRREAAELMDTAVDVDISHLNREPSSDSSSSATLSMSATALDTPSSDGQFDIATGAHAARRCNFCRGIVAADAMICPGCGKRIGVVEEEKAHAPRVRYARESFFSSTKKTWPEVIGLTGVCCGRLELLVAALWLILQMITIIRSEDIVNQLLFWELATWRISAGIVASLTLIGLAWWLSRTSDGMRMKSRQAVESIRFWAQTKIALSIAAFILTFALAPEGLADSTVLLFAVTLVWLLLWPAFILYWTGQLVIRQQVHEWVK